MKNFFAHFLLMLIILNCSSCAVLGRKGKWGKDALWSLKSRKVLKALKTNAANPHVWVPLIGAGVSYLGNFEKRASSWAIEKRYVYDDEENTGLWSNRFNNILLYEMYLSVLLTPSMDEDSSLFQYALSKSKGALVVNVASQSTRYTRDQLAEFFKRERPNKMDHMSFPSGHSTEAAARNSLISKMVDSMQINDSLKTGIKTVNTSMAMGTLWARLEGKRHYPADILTGYALGTFLSGFIYDSLMNLEDHESFSITQGRDGISGSYSVRF